MNCISNDQVEAVVAGIVLIVLIGCGTWIFTVYLKGFDGDE